jgi:phosphomannomutase / phosphoglucomutase
MTEIDAGIFRKYDIRGLAEGDQAVITPDAARQIGQAFGTYLQRFEQMQQVVVGHDNRRTSFELCEAAVKGLAVSGVDVVNIGLVATPVLYWSSVQRDNIGGLMITGSHLKPDQNGFKLCVGNRTLYGGQIKLIRSFIDNKNLAYGDGAITTDQSIYSEYVNDLEQRLEMPRALHIVVDGGNGTGGLFAPRLFKLWGHHITQLYCDTDGNFPNHQPDPQNPENMRDLGKKVVEVGADLGVAFDGDADRMGAVDENGDMIAADRLLALLARDMLKRHPGAKVVADVLSSQVLFNEIEKAGGKPIMAASGHSLVKDEMRNQGALLGGEMSGHIFLGEDYYGFDDPFLAAGRLFQLMTAGNKPLSDLNATLPTLYSTPEYRPHCPDKDKETVIDGVAQALTGKGEVVDVDGVRINFRHGWGLLRASNTEPVLSLRFEGETEGDALQYRDLFVEALKAYPQVESIV